MLLVSLVWIHHLQNFEDRVTFPAVLEVSKVTNASTQTPACVLTVVKHVPVFLAFSSRFQFRSLPAHRNGLEQFRRYDRHGVGRSTKIYIRVHLRFRETYDKVHRQLQLVLQFQPLRVYVVPPIYESSLLLLEDLFQLERALPVFLLGNFDLSIITLFLFKVVIFSILSG